MACGINIFLSFINVVHSEKNNCKGSHDKIVDHCFCLWKVSCVVFCLDSRTLRKSQVAFPAQTHAACMTLPDLENQSSYYLQLMDYVRLLVMIWGNPSTFWPSLTGWNSLFTPHYFSDPPFFCYTAFTICWNF